MVLNNPVSEPINYAVRNAVLDLTQFKDYAEVASWFHPAAVEPYTYKGKTYALPETFTFPMFFYRTDIFEELGLKEPESWDDIIEMIPDLQKKNLSMAFPKDINGYALLLYQNGGDLYINEGEKSQPEIQRSAQLLRGIHRNVHLVRSADYLRLSQPVPLGGNALRHPGLHHV